MDILGIQSGGARYGFMYVIFDVGMQLVHPMGVWVHRVGIEVA